MTIAPVRTRVEVKVPPEQAFALFTGAIGRWWPAGRTIGAKPHADIVLEPRPGGRWFERDAEGTETDWGKVLAWEPPGRLLLAWQLNSAFRFDPAIVTEVELRFNAGGAGTVVTLEHRDLERLGADAQRAADQIGEGWPRMLGQFAFHVNAP